MYFIKKSLFILLLTSLASCSTTVIDKVEPPAAKVSYTKDIKAIITANCTMTCHSPSTQLNAGLDLSTYATLRAATENRNVVVRIKNTGAPMPPAPQTPLSDAEIVLIEKWVSDGFLEN